MDAVEWSEEMSRAYATYMERNVKHDHRRFAARIAADWPGHPRGARVVLSTKNVLSHTAEVTLWKSHA